jgi:hypothetical protein
MINELNAETKKKIEKQTKRAEYILEHGNRIQKILLVCDPSTELKMMWLTGGLKLFLNKITWKYLWSLIRYDYWDKAKLIWDRKVLN